MIPPDQALALLREGNARYVRDRLQAPERIDAARREEVADGQRPFAVVLACSDSRVPVEIVFDQGLGDLFVVRVAGNIALPSQIGSAEFATEALGARAVVVLGHTGCGAVGAALEDVRAPGTPRSPALATVLGPIADALRAEAATRGVAPASIDADEAAAWSVRATVDRLRTSSEALTRGHRAGDIRIVGAVYSLDTGAVTFLDEE